jgi:hypothetical protein
VPACYLKFLGKLGIVYIVNLFNEKQTTVSNEKKITENSKNNRKPSKKYHYTMTVPSAIFPIPLPYISSKKKS